MFTPTTQNTIKYTYQLSAESQLTCKSRTSIITEPLATVQEDNNICGFRKGDSK